LVKASATFVYRTSCPRGPADSAEKAIITEPSSELDKLRAEFAMRSALLESTPAAAISTFKLLAKEADIETLEESSSSSRRLSTPKRPQLERKRKTSSGTKFLSPQNTTIYLHRKARAVKQF
jgi:hypothetical protein